MPQQTSDLAFRDNYTSMQRELSRPPPTPAAAPAPQLLFSAPSFIRPHSLSPQNRLQCAHTCPCRPWGLEANTVLQIRSDPGRRKRATNLGHAEKSTVSGMFSINVSQDLLHLLVTHLPLAHSEPSATAPYTLLSARSHPILVQMTFWIK